LPIDVLSIILVTNLLAYPIAVQTNYNRAPGDFQRGIIESRQKAGDTAMFKALFEAHPTLAREIMQEAYGYGLPVELRKTPKTDEEGTAVVRKHLSRVLSTDILTASDASVIALFEATSELVRTLSKMGYYQCDALLNGKLSGEALVTYVEREKVEAASAGWQNVFNTARSHVGAPFDVSDWQNIISSSLSAEAKAEIDRLMGSAEKKNCLTEVIWRDDWKSFPADRKAVVARGVLLSAWSATE
jgi:hypothetical protein